MRNTVALVILLSSIVFTFNELSLGQEPAKAKDQKKGDGEKVTWETDFGAFLDDVSREKILNGDRNFGKYVKKTVTWKLKFLAVEKKKDGPEIKFDLTRFGPPGTPADFKKRGVIILMSFQPAATALPDWEKLTKDSVVSFQGTHDGIVTFGGGSLPENAGAVVIIKELRLTKAKQK